MRIVLGLALALGAWATWKIESAREATRIAERITQQAVRDSAAARASLDRLQRENAAMGRYLDNATDLLAILEMRADRDRQGPAPVRIDVVVPPPPSVRERHEQPQTF